MYTNYKIARNMSWKALIDTGVSHLPLSLSQIATYYGIQILSYSDSDQLHTENEDGYSTKLNGRFIIYYNDLKPKTRTRFTIAHELGHCLLGHVMDNAYTCRINTEADTYTDPKEIQANVFARDLLMPATVLHSLNVQSAKDIARLCNVSLQSAQIRYERLLELNKRGMYNRHPLEWQVYKQFKDYINKSI